MQFICNMLHYYVTHLLMCLSSLGQLHIVHLTMLLTLLMKTHHPHVISSTDLARTNLMLCRSTLIKCWKRAGYVLVYRPTVHQSCWYARKWESCVCVSTFAASTIRPSLTCSQYHVFMTYWINWVKHVYFLPSTCRLRTTRCASRRGMNIALLFLHRWVSMNMQSCLQVLQTRPP